MRLYGVGPVKIILRRSMEGAPKTATITRSSAGKCYVCFTRERAEPSPLPATTQQVGIDVGLKTLATPSDGQKIANPRFFRQKEWALAKVQRKLSKHEKGTSKRAKCRRAVTHIHERIAWRRSDFTDQHSRRIVSVLTVSRRRAGPCREAGGSAVSSVHFLSICSPVRAKSEAVRREEAPALRTRNRALGPGRPLRRDRSGAPPAPAEHPLLGRVN
jgi:hypothetical protein